MLEQINSDVTNEMVDPVQRLVQCVRERLGAGQTDHQRTHQARPGGHRDAVDLRQIDVCGSAGSMQGRHHGLQVRATGHLGYHTAKPHMQLNAGGHFIGQQLVPPNNADARLIA